LAAPRISSEAAASGRYEASGVEPAFDFIKVLKKKKKRGGNFCFLDRATTGSDYWPAITGLGASRRMGCFCYRVKIIVPAAPCASGISRMQPPSTN